MESIDEIDRGSIAAMKARSINKTTIAVGLLAHIIMQKS